MPPKQKMRIDYQRLYALINEGLPEIVKLANKDVVVVMGPTRAGKTTLINYLLGNKMKIEKRDDFGRLVHGRRRGTIGIYRDTTANNDVPFLEVKGTKMSETKLPMVVEHEQTCYVDLPGLLDFRKKDPEVKLASKILLELGLKCAKSVRAIFLVFNVEDFTRSSTRRLDDALSILSSLLKDVSSPHAVHLVMNNKDSVLELAKKRTKLEDIASIIRNYNKEARLDYITENINTTKESYQTEITALEQRQRGWLPIFSGCALPHADQDPAEQALLRRYRRTKQFLSCLTHTLNLLLFSVADQDAINETIQRWNGLQLSDKKLSPILIRDCAQKRWFLRAVNGKGRLIDETNVAADFKAKLDEIAFYNPLTSEIINDLNVDLEIILYGDTNVCKVILFNPIDIGESRNDIATAIAEGGCIPTSEFNFSEYTQYQAFLNAIKEFLLEFTAKIDDKSRLEARIPELDEEINSLARFVEEGERVEEEENSSLAELVEKKKVEVATQEAKYRKYKRRYKALKNSTESEPYGNKPLTHSYNSFFFWETHTFTFPDNDEIKAVPLIFNESTPSMEINGKGRWYKEGAPYNCTKNSYTSAEIQSNWKKKQEFYNAKECRFKVVFRSDWRDKGDVSLSFRVLQKHGSKKNKLDKYLNNKKDAKSEKAKADRELGKYQTSQGAKDNYPIKQQEKKDAEDNLALAIQYLQKVKGQAFAICFVLEKIPELNSRQEVQSFIQKCKSYYYMSSIEIEDVAATNRIDIGGRQINTSNTTTSANGTTGVAYQASPTGVEVPPACSTPPSSHGVLSADRFAATNESSGDSHDFMM